MRILHEVGDSASPSAVPGKILPDATIQARAATDPDVQAHVEAAQSLLRLKKPAGTVVAAVARRALA
ncbi:MAG: hypothetical protein KDJ70_07655 [Candidatus Competibacteraceae bacterium]|nr:hypothetical protein [Candidatus Competibacteraceae bacterium]